MSAFNGITVYHRSEIMNKRFVVFFGLLLKIAGFGQDGNLSFLG